jgi:hypothetical protein
MCDCVCDGGEGYVGVVLYVIGATVLQCEFGSFICKVVERVVAVTGCPGKVYCDV